MTVKEFRDIGNKMQKLFLILSATIKVDLKEATKEEQILLNETETEADSNMDLKVDLKMPDHKNHVEINATLDLQMKLDVVLIIKVDIHIINQKRDLDSFLILDL